MAPRTLALSLALAWLSVCGGQTSAQAPPGSAEELREGILAAQLCYDAVDYGCVVQTLEGPLMVRSELPQGLSRDEVRTAYELLALGYLATSLDREAELALRRLLALDPAYSMERTDVSPATRKLVDDMREKVRLEGVGARVARHVALRTDLLVSLSDPREGVGRVISGLGGADYGGWVVRRTERAGRIFESPPWGPIAFPVVGLTASWRTLFGADGASFGPGFGVRGRLGVSYLPVYGGVAIGWNRHEALTANPVLSPNPALDHFSFGFEGGFRGSLTDFVGWALGAEVGLKYLHVTDELSSVNPSMGLVAELHFPIVAGVVAETGVLADLTLGPLQSGEVGASSSLSVLVGFGFAP